MRGIIEINTANTHQCIDMEVVSSMQMVFQKTVTVGQWRLSTCGLYDLSSLRAVAQTQLQPTHDPHYIERCPPEGIGLTMHVADRSTCKRREHNEWDEQTINRTNEE
jgi:hypothetical protein